MCLLKAHRVIRDGEAFLCIEKQVPENQPCVVAMCFEYVDSPHRIMDVRAELNQEECPGIKTLSLSSPRYYLGPLVDRLLKIIRNRRVAWICISHDAS